MYLESAAALPSEEQTILCRYQVVKTIADIAQTMQTTIASDTTEVAVVKAQLHFASFEQDIAHYQEQAAQSTLYMLRGLRPLVRKTDSVFLLDHTLYFILPAANVQGGKIVEERLWDALLWRIHNAQELPEIAMLLPAHVTMGHSASLWPCDDILAVLRAAHVQRNFTLSPSSPTPQTVETPIEHDILPGEESQLSSQARELGIPYLTFLPRKSATKVRRLLNPQLALELHCYPLGRERDVLTVAMSNPQDRTALDRLHQETGLHIFPVLAPAHELQTALEQLV